MIQKSGKNTSLARDKMKEISLLLRPEMARAYALGRKTHTRRLITRLRGIGSITEFGPSATPEHFSSFDWQFRDRHNLWHDVDTGEKHVPLAYTMFARKSMDVKY